MNSKADEKLAGALEHVLYEALMLERAYTSYWSTEIGNNVHDWQHCYLLEATLIHVRALMSFFEDKPPKKPQSKHDDILAVQFGYPETKLDFGGLDGEMLREAINKRIAHLTHTRTKGVEVWPFRRFVPVILRQMKDFFEKLNKSVIEVNPIIGMTLGEFNARVSAIKEDHSPYSAAYTSSPSML